MERGRGDRMPLGRLKAVLPSRRQETSHLCWKIYVRHGHLTFSRWLLILCSALYQMLREKNMTLSCGTDVETFHTRENLLVVFSYLIQHKVLREKFQVSDVVQRQFNVHPGSRNSSHLVKASVTG